MHREGNTGVCVGLFFIFIKYVIKNKFSFTMAAWEQWVNCLVQEQNNRFLPCQLRDSSNALTTRLPAGYFPFGWGVSHMPFGKHQRCLLIIFLKQWIFFWPLFYKAQLCEVYSLKWSYGQILQSPLWSFAAPSGLSLVFFCL